MHNVKRRTFKDGEQAPGAGAEDEDAPEVLPGGKAAEVDGDVEPHRQAHEQQRVHHAVQAALHPRLVCCPAAACTVVCKLIS